MFSRRLAIIVTPWSKATRAYCTSFMNPRKYDMLKVEEKNESRSIWVTFNRPTLHNAFNPVLIQEITDVFRSIGAFVDGHQGESSGHPLRSVVLTGEGKSFSAGADLNWMKSMAKYSTEENYNDACTLFDMFQSIKDCPIPVVGRVNGAALGGGTGLVAACDFAFTLSGAKFGFTEVKLGLIPAVISPFLLSKINRTSANRYFATAELFDGKKAVEIGLANEHFENIESLDSSLSQTLSNIASNSPAAVKASKRLITDVFRFKTLPETREFVANAIADIRVSKEGQEGINAFLNKEKAPWTL